ncbi:MAG: hypothetical protein Q4A75_03310 [Peptostreptococcaceae bacterium]|nr:hypothetical protein [Peptostreptococcaceae bacterium]
MRTTKVFCLLLMMIVLTSCTFSDRVYLYKEKELTDGNRIILNETAMIDSFENEYITVIPDEDALLLISVVEFLNKNDMPIDVSTYFDQVVLYSENRFGSRIFSLDGDRIKKGRQAYIYMISELPYGSLSKIGSDEIEVKLRFGEDELTLRSSINNNYGLQENILNKYRKIQELNMEFDRYWSNDLKGFQEFAQKRTEIKNYNQIYDWVFSIQKEYESINKVLDIYLEEMSHIKLLTPIYPDANIKVLSETRFLQNNLKAIIETENTCMDQTGLDLFLINCQNNLDKAEQANREVIKEIEKDIRKERFEYGGFR